MASPYFQDLKLSQADYSPISQAGANIGRMYADMGANIGAGLGKAIGAVGSKYFEDKKVERAMSDYMKTSEGQDWALERGYTPFDIQEWGENPKALPKEIKKMVSDVGGMEKVREEYRDEQKFEMSRKTNELNYKNLQDQREQNQILLKDLKRKDQDSDTERSMYAHILGKDKDGNQRNSLAGYEITDDNAHVAARLNKAGYGVGAVNVAQYLSKTQNAGTKGTQDFFTYPNKVRGEVNNYNIATGADADASKKNLEYVNGLIIEPEKISQNFETSFFKDGQNKKRMTAITIGKTFDGIYENALSSKEDGTFVVTDAVAASSALIKFATMMQEGVLSEGDITRLQGDQAWYAGLERLREKYFPQGWNHTENPSVTIMASQADVDAGFAKNIGDKITRKVKGSDILARDLQDMKRAVDAISKINNEELGTSALASYDALQGAYPTISRERLLELIPQRKYIDDKYDFTPTNAEMTQLGRHINTSGVDKAEMVQSILNANPRMQPAEAEEMFDSAKQMFGSTGAREMPNRLNDDPNTMNLEPDMSDEARLREGGFLPPLGEPKEAEVDYFNDPSIPEANIIDVPDGDTRLETRVPEEVVDQYFNAAGHTLMLSGVAVGQGVLEKIFTKKGKDMAITKSAEKMFGRQLASAIAKDPFKIFGNEGGEQALKSLAKKYGVKASGKGVEAAIKKKIESKMRRGIAKYGAQKGGKAIVKKLLSPKFYAKRLIPFAGLALLAYDAYGVIDIFNSEPTEGEVKSMTSGFSPYEMIIADEFVKKQKS